MKINENKIHAIAAKYILGESFDAEIDGKTVQIKTLRELLEVSKNLRNQLHEGASLDEVMETIEHKKTLTRRFQDLTGITWRL